VTHPSEASGPSSAAEDAQHYELICIGASWGGLQAISRVLADIPTEVEQPIAIVQHRSTESVEGALPDLLQLQTSRPVDDVDDKTPIERGKVYLAPPDYHLLVEPGSFALSVDERVQHARPSIDVLFESAADAYRERVIGVILTGANEDGAVGLARIKARGGVAVIQDPAGAKRRAMPDAAIAATVADAVLPLEAIGKFIYGLCVEPASQAPVRGTGPLKGVWGNREVPSAPRTEAS
jgi:two-component system, chemotaxis family, protein-glutamate methylesterase/glutaminase